MGAQKGVDKMRYVEGRFDQFVDQRKKLSGYERFELRHEFRQRGVEMLRGAWGQMRSQVQHTDDEDRYGTGLDQGLPYKTGYVQMRDDDLPERQKPTKTPLIMFIVMIIAVIGSSIFFNFAVTMAVFFGFFAVFGFYAAYKNNGRSYSHYEGATSTGSRKNGLILGFFGLAGMIPLLFSGKFGISGALILMMIAMFTAVGILLIVGFFSSLTLKQRKYTEEVCANAVAYVRTLGSSHNHSSASHHGNSGNVSIRTSPLFEYTYQGRTYQALYDRPIDGSNADIDLGPATIYIDPEHPEDVYQETSSLSCSARTRSVRPLPRASARTLSAHSATRSPRRSQTTWWTITSAALSDMRTRSGTTSLSMSVMSTRTTTAAASSSMIQHFLRSATITMFPTGTMNCSYSMSSTKMRAQTVRSISASCRYCTVTPTNTLTSELTGHMKDK